MMAKHRLNSDTVGLITRHGLDTCGSSWNETKGSVRVAGIEASPRLAEDTDTLPGIR